jgi:Tfp pilus assembly protein PilO
MQLLSQTAADRSLSVVSLRPREDYRPEAENLPRSINKIYMEIVLACNYQEMAEFINALNTLPMKLNIESMTVEKNQNAPAAGDTKAVVHPAGAAPELQVTFLLSTIFG